MPDVVVVESPAKARTINKYLGGGYTVLASLGHVRDLPAKDGSVRPAENFAMDWQADARGSKQVAAIAQALKSAHTLYLATDPDREGEAISWHVKAMLDAKHALKGVAVRRIAFNEVTKTAVRAAMAAPRELDQPLIEAYLARRALDYLVGFTLSPVLWRKLPGSRSAGRVQSVALRLVCEREAAIEVFHPREYWTVEAEFLTPRDERFTARLTHLDGKKLGPFAIATAAEAKAARERIEAGSFRVAAVEKKRSRRNPPPPFTTSTLQQEANRKLGFGAQATMRVAQQLYEGVDLAGETVGLITYMRTDGVQVAREAVQAMREYVQAAFGANYLPPAPRQYTVKAKNAQEAHEAIRPTNVERRPEDVRRALSPGQHRLYELIWKRALASQMASVEVDQVGVDISDEKPLATSVRLRANGSTIAFDGFYRLYREDRDEPDEDEAHRALPPMAKDEALRRGAVEEKQHFTDPPPRYSEASLVKALEELGIGRPSTYASILSVLQERNYVRLEQRRFVPEDRGRLVTAFLVSFFNRYVDTGFTAALEEQLDDISGGRADWREVMRAFWEEFSRAVDGTKDLKISDVLNALDEDLGPHFFAPRADGTDPRVCPACKTGRLALKLGRFGAFIGCSNYPDCPYTRRLAIASTEDAEHETLKDGIRVVGKDPASGEEITLRRGPYGLYVQRGEAKEKQKPPRVALPRGLSGEQLTLEQAAGLLALPRTVGSHPETGEAITAGIGRFGPFVRMGGVFASLGRDDDVLTVGLNRAVDVLAKKLAGIRNLGSHPTDHESVLARKGRFGPYVQHGKTVATPPKGTTLETITLEQAVALLAEKGRPLKGRTKTNGRAKTAASHEAAQHAAKRRRKSAG